MHRRLARGRVVEALLLCLLDAALTCVPQAEHKIQSSGGAMQLLLQPVPKLLGLVQSEWCPDAMCVSFKVGGAAERGRVAQTRVGCVDAGCVCA